MDIITLIGAGFLVVALLILVGVAPGGIVAAIVCAVIGLIILGGGITNGRRTRL